MRDEEAYLAVESNASGSRPKEMFEDMIEELEADFEKDKVRFGRCGALALLFILFFLLPTVSACARDMCACVRGGGQGESEKRRRVGKRW